MPSWELFRERTIPEQKSVFPKGIPVMAIEAGSYLGWREYSHAALAMHRFGASAPGPELFEKFGFTTKNAVEKAKEVIAFYQIPGNVAHDLIVNPFTVL